MSKTDYEINQWVASCMESDFSFVVSATANPIENYGVNDIDLKLNERGKVIDRMVEVKSIKKGNLKYGNEFNLRYSTMNPCGIMKNIKFGNVPPSNMSIMDVPYHWEPEVFSPSDAPMPEEWENKYIYMLNATDMYNNFTNGKTYKIYKNNASVVYVAADGLLFFSPKKLREAFLGYAWFLNSSHTEERGQKYEPVWELKCFFDLNK